MTEEISDFLEVGDLKLHMSYGMLQDVSRLVPNGSEVIELVMTDSYVRDYMIRRALTPKTSMIQSEEELISAEEISLSTQQISDVLDWVAAHVLGFWMRSAQNLRKRGQALKQLEADLSTQSAAGSPA